jgi:hypothetical protein
MQVRRLTDPDLDDPDRKLLADIAEHGLHVTYILPQDNTPGWHFSVGMYATYGQPEIVTFGVSESVGHHLINQLGRHARDGSALTPEALYPDLLEGVSCVLKPVDPIWHEPLLGYARWYYKSQAFPALQCVWPDHSQVFPWEPTFPAKWRAVQPYLWHSTAREAGMESILDTLKE